MNLIITYLSPKLFANYMYYYIIIRFYMSYHNQTDQNRPTASRSQILYGSLVVISKAKSHPYKSSLQ